MTDEWCGKLGGLGYGPGLSEDVQSCRSIRSGTRLRRELQTREWREKMKRMAARPWGVSKQQFVKQWEIEAPRAVLHQC